MSIFDEDAQLDDIDDTVEQYSKNSKCLINAVDNVQDLNNAKFTYNGQMVYVKNENKVFCKIGGNWEKFAYVSV